MHFEALLNTPNNYKDVTTFGLIFSYFLPLDKPRWTGEIISHFLQKHFFHMILILCVCMCVRKVYGTHVFCIEYNLKFLKEPLNLQDIVEHFVPKVLKTNSKHFFIYFCIAPSVRNTVLIDTLKFYTHTYIIMIKRKQVLTQKCRLI